VRRSLRKIVLAGGGLLLLATGMGVAVYQASQQVPDFYQEALTADVVRQEAASRQMLQQATTLVNEAQKPGIWRAEFTDEQINGWLAVDLEQKHPDALPKQVSDPRVAIRSDGARIGWRWNTEGLSTVFWLDMDVYLAEPNVLALEIRGAQAGTVPLPLSRVLDEVTRVASSLDLQVSWAESEGHPTALLKIPPPEEEDNKAVIVDDVELRDGSLYLSGKTVPLAELAQYLKEAQAAEEAAEQGLDHAVGSSPANEKLTR
jgi:hypothetical protein